MDEFKPAIKSLGFWGGLSAIGGTLGLIRDLLEVYQAVDPAIIQDIIIKGNAAYFAIVALFGAIAAFIGRLRADKRISGIFTSR